MTVRSANHTADRNLGRYCVHITAESILGVWIRVQRRWKAAMLCVGQLSCSVTWLASPTYQLFWCGLLESSWVSEDMRFRLLVFQQLMVLIWLCSYCVTLVSLCIPFPLSMTSVLLYLCSHSHDAPVGVEVPCRVWTQGQEASLVFLKGLLSFTPSLGMMCDFHCACLLAKRPGPNVLLCDILRTPFLVSWVDWHWISLERKQTMGFLIFFSSL